MEISPIRARIGPLTTMSGAAKWVEVETPWRLNNRITRALGGGDHHRQVAGPASSQHRVDRGLLDGEPAVVRRHLTKQLVARAFRAGEHPLDPLSRRRHDWQSVGHALVEPDLELVGRHRAVGRCYTGSPVPRIPALGSTSRKAAPRQR
jgi:hypothetical protein